MAAASALSAKIAVTFALIVIGLELIFLRLVRHVPYNYKEAVMSIVMGLGYAKMSTLSSLIWGWLYFFFWEHRIFTVSMDTWYAWVGLFIVSDFAYYWMHRYAHRTRLGWVSHLQHHSPTEMNMSVSARLSVTASLSGYTAFFAPLAILGFHPVAIALCLLINIVWQAPLHTKTIGKLWWPIEYVFNTPSHHRAHHGSNEVYLDKNYGAIFVLWDRMFGTLQEELADEPVIYGLTRKVEARNYPTLMLTLFFREWGLLACDVWSAKTFKHKVEHLFRPPGWTAPEQDAVSAGATAPVVASGIESGRT